MLVFLRGQWHDIALPFSDPILTEGHKRWAAAVVARHLAAGHSQREATDLAEKALFERMYGSDSGSGSSGSSGVSRKQHNAPKN